MSKIKLVFGVGVNDSDYKVKPKVNGKKICCLFYRRWTGMLQRCYSSEYHDKFPTYKDCYVCDDWLVFSEFKKWMETQDWQGKQLDKDIAVTGNKIYSPSTCCFVEPWLNSLFNNLAALRGSYPIGVSKIRNKFQVYLRVNSYNKYLGIFDTPKEASIAYQKAKRQYVIDKMKDYPDQLIKRAVLAKIAVT